MQRNTLETFIGFLVLLVSGLFFYDAYRVTQVNYGVNGSYVLKARFERIDGLNLGSDIKIGGIKIGKVVKLDLDPKTYQAVATLQLKHDIKLPKDSTAAVGSNGLFGEKYVTIVPGADDELLANNDTIQYTQSPVNLENLLGKFMFNSNQDQKK